MSVNLSIYYCKQIIDRINLIKIADHRSLEVYISSYIYLRPISIFNVSQICNIRPKRWFLAHATEFRPEARILNLGRDPFRHTSSYSSNIYLSTDTIIQSITFIARYTIRLRNICQHLDLVSIYLHQSYIDFITCEGN